MKYKSASWLINQNILQSMRVEYAHVLHICHAFIVMCPGYSLTNREITYSGHKLIHFPLHLFLNFPISLSIPVHSLVFIYVFMWMWCLIGNKQWSWKQTPFCLFQVFKHIAHLELDILSTCKWSIYNYKSWGKNVHNLFNCRSKRP